LSKIHTGFPPERTVWIEASNRFSACCVSSNLLRCVFARTFQDYPILPWCVKLKRFSPLPLRFCTNVRLGPLSGHSGYSANLSNINREHSSRRVADHPAWSFSGRDESLLNSSISMDCSVWPYALSNDPPRSVISICRSQNPQRSFLALYVVS
jgi:hypothetical protein